MNADRTLLAVVVLLLLLYLIGFRIVGIWTLLIALVLVLLLWGIGTGQL